MEAVAADVVFRYVTGKIQAPGSLPTSDEDQPSAYSGLGSSPCPLYVKVSPSVGSLLTVAHSGLGQRADLYARIIPFGSRFTLDPPFQPWSAL